MTAGISGELLTSGKGLVEPAQHARSIVKGEKLLSGQDAVNAVLPYQVLSRSLFPLPPEL